MFVPRRVSLKSALFASVLACAAVVPFGSTRAQDPRLTPEVLQQLLQAFPAADANQDGVLTEEEARAYYAAMRSRKSGGAALNVAPPATLTDVAYGPYPRNVLDFWQAPSANSGHPAPVVVYIHGGGFISGDKSGIRRDRIVQQCLDAGVSFAAINYRYLNQAAPIQDVLRDCARAVQFIRAQAGAWHVDPARLAAYGVSAGAGASLWMAVHPDLADRNHADPVLRESTRLVCVGAISPQFSYDWLRWTDVFGAAAVARFGNRYDSPELYGLPSVEAVRGPDGQKIRADCDMLGLISKDDPPVFLTATLPDLALENTNQFLHHPKHGQLLYERCREVGVPVVAAIPALGIAPPRDAPSTWRDFLFRELGVTPVPGAGPASAPR